MREVYEKYKADDGFLYVTYANVSVFWFSTSILSIIRCPISPASIVLVFFHRWSVGKMWRLGKACKGRGHLWSISGLCQLSSCLASRSLLGPSSWSLRGFSSTFAKNSLIICWQAILKKSMWGTASFIRCDVMVESCSTIGRFKLECSTREVHSNWELAIRECWHESKQTLCNLSLIDHHKDLSTSKSTPPSKAKNPENYPLKLANSLKKS